VDKVRIEGLVCRAHVGVSAAERSKRQKILIDLELELDLGKAGQSDRVEHTVDYAAVAREVKKLAEERPFILVEAITEAAAGLLLKRFRIRTVTVRVWKFSVPGTKSVGVEITRSRLRRRSGFPRSGFR
jgi:dihydroneopterin aldolase